MGSPSNGASVSDIMECREYGVNKSRKAASSGAGRAWSGEEEAYLLQTRLQKMPYKHIAAHLKKTELACRLHYHQLSHGGNRRKRTSSTSSDSSIGGHSPVLAGAVPSPIRDHDGLLSRSITPPASIGSYGPGSPNPVLLPSIHSVTARDPSPRLPAILPKPASMALGLSSGNALSPLTAARDYPTPLPEQVPHLPLLPGSTHTLPSIHAPHAHHLQHHLRLESHPVHPPSQATSFPHISPRPPTLPLHHSTNGPVDMARLQSAYAMHKNAFWNAVASEYGGGVNPATLEQAWRASLSTSTSIPSSSLYSSYSSHHLAPVIPMDSLKESAKALKPAASSSDRTRISAILGIDANPRSPGEREIVRRIEEGRCAVVGA